MANSEFLFEGKSKNMKDSIIGRFVDELIEILEKEELCWLKEACNVWQEDWQTLPPGCKDIDLNLVLTSKSQKVTFVKKVREVQNIIEEDSIKKELECLLKLIE